MIPALAAAAKNTKSAAEPGCNKGMFMFSDIILDKEQLHIYKNYIIIIRLFFINVLIKIFLSVS